MHHSFAIISLITIHRLKIGVRDLEGRCEGRKAKVERGHQARGSALLKFIPPVPSFLLPEYILFQTQPQNAGSTEDKRFYILCCIRVVKFNGIRSYKFSKHMTKFGLFVFLLLFSREYLALEVSSINLRDRMGVCASVIVSEAILANSRAKQMPLNQRGLRPKSNRERKEQLGSCEVARSEANNGPYYVT